MENQIKILVVEDEAIFAMSIKRVLANLGYQVLKLASTGEEAVLEAKQKKPDLVILDVLLGGNMNGFEVADHLRSMYDIPIIFISGFQKAELENKIKMIRNTTVLIKPFDPDDLIHVINKLLTKP